METAVILSGCGVRDGSEIHESTCLLLSLVQANHRVTFFAPDKAQCVVINGITGKPAKETRNVLTESARIARGETNPLSELNVHNFDAILLPGGMGAVMNLCNFAHTGTTCEVDPELERVLTAAHKAGKILGFMCIAPVIAACLFKGVKITVGDAGVTSAACEKMGAQHVVCREDEVCIDEDKRIISVPAYMKAADITGCYKSTQALVKALDTLASKHPMK